jgi:hypothetical protein
VTGRGEHRIDRLAVKAAGLDLRPHLRCRFVARERQPIRARLAHRLVRVGSAKEPSRT